MREGYTTGSCAQAAAKAAALMLVSGEEINEVKIMTPSGRSLTLDVEDPVLSRGGNHCYDAHGGWASCAIKKDSGEDPDVTNGMLIYARVKILDTPGIIIQGGRGIGRVTRPGLDQPVGNAAINSTPRKMIEKEVEEVLGERGIPGAEVLVFAPKGEEIAKKTFNEKLGIMGGISILGTSGIVRPMSSDAIIATIRNEISVRSAEGQERLYMSPGNYGADYLRDTLGIDRNTSVETSNYIKVSMELAKEFGYKDILFAGHIGKMIKVAKGAENTHSKYGDERLSTLWRFTREVLGDTEDSMSGDGVSAPGDLELIREEMLASVSTDKGIEILDRIGITEEVCNRVAISVKDYLEKWSGAEVKFYLFTGGGRTLAVV